MNLRGLGENPGLKALSLGIAVVLWLMAQGEQTHRVTLVAPVTWILPKDLILLEDDPLPDQVVIVASGRGSAVRQARDGSFPYEVDLRDVSAGRTVHSFRGPPDGFPGELRIETISPAMVELSFDEPMAKTMPVRLRTRGELPAGYREVKREVQPPVVTLVAARREIDSREAVETQTFSLSERTSSFEGHMALDLRGLHLPPGAPGEVSVRFVVEEIRGERLVPSLRIGVPKGFSIEPSEAAVRLGGPEPLLEELARGGVHLSLDGDVAAAIGGGAQGIVPWAATVPEGAAAALVVLDHPRAAEVRVLGVEPATFTVSRVDP